LILINKKSLSENRKAFFMLPILFPPVFHGDIPKKSGMIETSSRFIIKTPKTLLFEVLFFHVVKLTTAVGGSQSKQNKQTGTNGCIAACLITTCTMPCS
jgi:hypothetical protein